MNCLHKWLRVGVRCRRCISPVSSFIINMSSQSDEVRWLWKADEAARDFHEAFLKGTRMGLFEITFNTTRPLQPNQFQQALQHLLRKTPPLQVCLRKRNGSLWFCLPTKLHIDNQIMDSDSSIRDVTYQALKDGYPGPEFTQWRTRLIPKRPETPCSIPRIKEMFPYQYDLMFTGHHGWMDGIDAVFIMSCLQQIISDVIGGKPVSDDVHGSFSRNVELEEMINRVKENFLKNENRFEDVKSTIPASDHISYLLQAFPPPKVSTPTSKHITKIIDPLVLKIFLTKSKEAEVTFNSSFMTVIITAIVELIRLKGVISDAYNITSLVQANLRRYLKPSDLHHKYGLYSNLMSYTLGVDKNVRDSFWDNCRKVNSELQCMLKQGFPLEQRVARDLLEANYPASDYVNIVKPAVHDFSISNLGDISSFFPNSVENVCITHIAPLNFIHNFVHSNFHEILSFRGRSYYTFTYATNYLSDETAHTIVDEIISVLMVMSK